jgi:4-amino-4-deoxy-L-arabinose transferase-like glycosyltransferase
VDLTGRTDRKSNSTISRGRSWSQAVLILLVLYGALIRLDALFDSYGPYQNPRWLANIQPAVQWTASRLVPPTWQWPHVAEPYEGGDPQNYIRFAREMRGFYQAHVREPMFLAAGRFFLWLAGWADVGISLASIALSVMTIPAIYALGCQLSSPLVGLSAAAAFAIDRDVVDWSIGGWRDETFTFFVVLTAWAWLRFSRTERGAVLAGVVSAAACLTRITAITMLAPIWVWLAVQPDPPQRRDRWRRLAVGVGVAALLVAPYLINCAIQFGDPLFAINDHTRFYRASEGVANAPSESAARYVLNKIESHPLATTDTAVRGLVVYPFIIKWGGLDAWIGGLGRSLSWLAAAGLIAWLWNRSGRLMLLALVGSLVPYMLTWATRGGGEWRFTLHAYPFYLLAACWAAREVVLVARSASLQGFTPALTALRSRRAAAVAATLVATAVLATIWTFTMPYFISRESLLAGEETGIAAGARDRWMFADGWSRLTSSGNVVSRFTTKRSAVLRVPLPEQQSYRLVLRVDPLDYPDSPLQTLSVALNDHLLGSFRLTYTPGHIGEYQVSVPSDAVRPGLNALTLSAPVLTPIARAGVVFPEIPRDQAVGVRLWYVRIIPGGAP